MRLTKNIIQVMTLTAGMSSASFAGDCGAPPLDSPVLPSPSSITAEELKSARTRTIQFSEAVDTYMTCMDEQGSKLLPYLTKEQQTRWEEDLTEIHESRRQLQIALNDLIRDYRKQSPSN